MEYSRKVLMKEYLEKNTKSFRNHTNWDKCNCIAFRLIITSKFNKTISFSSSHNNKSNTPIYFLIIFTETSSNNFGFCAFGNFASFKNALNYKKWRENKKNYRFFYFTPLETAIWFGCELTPYWSKVTKISDLWSW